MPAAKKSTRKKQVKAPDTPMSFADAAEIILRNANKPLSYTRITNLALQQSLVQTESQTPAISTYVALKNDIKRREERGEPQRVAFLGNGIFKLTEETQSAIDQVRESRTSACNTLYKKLTAENHGPEFELMVADLLIRLGYENVDVIGGKDDQGVDIVCEKRDGITLSRIAIQCKCKLLSKKVGPKDISTLRDNLSTYQCQQGILITTTKLLSEAHKKATETGKERIHVIEHEELLDLFAEHQIGIKSERVSFFRLDPQQYEFLKD